MEMFILEKCGGNVKRLFDNCNKILYYNFFVIKRLLLDHILFKHPVKKMTLTAF